MKNIVVLGSTGSIGRQALDVVRKSGRLRAVALAAGKNAALLEKQAREFLPETVCLYDAEAAADLKVRLADLPVRVLAGPEGLLEAAAGVPAEMAVIAISGMIALVPTIAAVRAGRSLAIANKETLVTAGHLLLPLAKKCGVTLLPVDSEHGAVFQCLQGEDRAKVRKILLTASGGPFRGKTLAEMENVTPEEALRHPNWAMGPKITVDSSTLINKGLEVMEAHWLYSMPYDRIQVVVHPQSIVHSMVEYADGSVKAQLAVPDMRLPIEYALFWPERREAIVPFLDFWNLKSLTFEKPDFENFPGLALGYEAGRQGGTMPTVYNAANECAVRLFLEGKLRYLDIVRTVEREMRAHAVIPDPDLDTVLAVEKDIRARLLGKTPSVP